MKAITLKDGYKVGHVFQYPENTQMVYSNFTARGSRIKGIDGTVYFGGQYLIKKYLIEEFNKSFFDAPIAKALKYYRRRMDGYLGADSVDLSHIESLHKLGYLPVEIRSVAEGTSVPIGVPMMTIKSMLPQFFWVTNMLETLISATLWPMITSATIAKRNMDLIQKYGAETGADEFIMKLQAHDFSMRGMFGVEAAAMSGAAHLTCGYGTDTLPALDLLEDYYGAEESDIIGLSVPASEHSVMCAGTEVDEYETYKRLITEVYPSGIVSIVSDTWDFWGVVDNVLPSLKDEIMSRDGKTVIRPDSGDPVEIICGVDIENVPPKYAESIEELTEYAEDGLVETLSDNTPHGECGDESISGLFRWKGDVYEVTFEPEWNRFDKQYYYIDGGSSAIKKVELTSAQLGLIESLWNTFGGNINEEGYKCLDDHIGAIYGDSITYERMSEILERLKAKGFVSDSIVFGIGSFTYQYNTRDTFNMAMKATAVRVNGETREIYKSPKTDSSKESAKGFIKVDKDHEGNLFAMYPVSEVEANTGELEFVWSGRRGLERSETLDDIRTRTGLI